MLNNNSNEKRGVNLRLTASSAESINQFIEEYAYHTLCWDTDKENSKVIREVNNEIVYELESFSKDNPNTEIQLDFFYFKTKKNFKTYNFKNGISKLQENNNTKFKKTEQKKEQEKSNKNRNDNSQQEKPVVRKQRKNITQK